MPAHGLPAELDRFIANADGKGTPLADLARSQARWTFTYGTVWVMVDKPPLNTARPLSAAEEVELGNFPYAEIRLTTDVLDGKMDGEEPIWLLIKEDYRDDEDPLTATGKIFTQYRLWEQHRIRLWRSKTPGVVGSAMELIEDLPNPLGRVPFVSFRFTEGSPFYSPGLISDIAYIERAIFNLQSQLDEILYKVTFPQLRYPLVAGPASPEAQKVLTVGIDSVIPYDPSNGSNGPDFISPSSEPAQVIQATIDNFLHKIYLLALLEGEMAASISQSHQYSYASGVAKAFSFEKLNKSLGMIASRFETQWRRVFRLVAEWQGLSPDIVPNDVWDWPDTFEVRSLQQDILEATGILALGIPSPQMKAEIFSQIAEKLFNKMDNDRLHGIIEEIHTMVTEESQGLIAPLTQHIPTPGSAQRGFLAPQ